jgi:hypothetical protein
MRNGIMKRIIDVVFSALDDEFVRTELDISCPQRLLGTVLRTRRSRLRMLNPLNKNKDLLR